MGERRFDGRVAVVTGGGRGLGRAYCELLASLGAKVVVNDIGASLAGDEKEGRPADEVVAAIKDAGGEAVANLDSVATAAGGKAIIETAMDNYGRCDILIHNAGNTRRKPLEEMDIDDFRAIIDVHLIGGFNVLQPAFAHMKKQEYGRIVLTASIGGVYGNYGVHPYSASKAGLIGMSHNAALEGQPHNIHSNAILPSAVTRMSEGIDTSQFPPLDPDFIAPGVGWLVHEECDISGEIFVALGGRMAKAYISETRGAVQKDWTVDDVANRMPEIDDRTDAFSWPVLPTEEGGPHGFLKHLGTSFEMVR